MGDLHPVNLDAPGGGPVQPCEDVHQRALTGAGRPHDGGELALRDVDVHVPQSVHGSIALAVGARKPARRDDRPRRTDVRALECFDALSKLPTSDTLALLDVERELLAPEPLTFLDSDRLHGCSFPECWAARPSTTVQPNEEPPAQPHDRAERLRESYASAASGESPWRGFLVETQEGDWTAIRYPTRISRLPRDGFAPGLRKACGYPSGGVRLPQRRRLATSDGGSCCGLG
jgi:hypothetical protein